MDIKEIYHKYKILPTLQTHLFRVAAVGKFIALNSLEPVEMDNIIITCLLHDMGNIIKFSLDYNPDSYEPEGVNYWMGIKKEFIDKYGNDEHIATVKIVKEIGVSKRVTDLIHNVGFICGKDVFKSKDLTKMICAYADLRVCPTGIISLEERIKEGVKRFLINRPQFNTLENNNLRMKMYAYYNQIEKYIFARSKIKSEDVSNESIMSLMDDLVMQKDFVL